MKIKISSVVNDSIVDGSGIRLAVFTQGCTHNCFGCQNTHTHSMDGGKEVDTEKIVTLLAENPLLDGVTLTGGEPFLQAKECVEIAKSAHALGLNVWTYTGFTYEEIINSKNKDFIELLNNTNILVDGKFIESEKSLNLKFRGSKNQKVIDVNETKKQNKVIELYK